MKMMQLLYEKVLALTIVVQWSSGLHNCFSVLHYLIHKTSIGGAAALLWSNGHCHMISGGSDGSEATFNVPQVPTAGQVTNGANPLWWKGRFRPTSAQCPLVGAFRHSFHFFFYFSCINIFPPADGGGSSKNKSYASTSLKSGVTITLLPAILSGNIFLIRDEKIYML